MAVQTDPVEQAIAAAITAELSGDRPLRWEVISEILAEHPYPELLGTALGTIAALVKVIARLLGVEPSAVWERFQLGLRIGRDE